MTKAKERTSGSFSKSGTLEIIRRGEGGAASAPPLLFVHGAWHGAWCWAEHFLDYFAGLGYQTAAVSLRGHGGSPGQERLRHHRIADYVADVAGAAATLPAPPVVIGHSMGGLVTQHYLARHPAAAGVLLASVPPRGVAPLALKLLRRDPVVFLRANLAASMYPLVATPARVRELFYSEAVPDADVARYAAALGDESYRAFWDMLVLDLPRRGRVRVPLRVLGGELDTIFPPARVHAAARFYRTRARIFPRTAHNLMLEPRWREVADDIHAWIASGFAGPEV